MISDIYRTYVQCAQGIPGFIVGQKEDVPYDITELANEYCKACDDKDELKRSQYMSALMIRYWHMVVMTYEQSKSTRLEVDDIASWIYEALEKAFTYRSWLDESKSISKDPKGAEKVINRCIYSVRNYWYRNFNKGKRKVNFNTYSLDTVVKVDKNETVPQIELIAGDDTCYDSSRDLVQLYIDKKKIVSAIILDHIMYQNCFKETVKAEVTDEEDEEGNPVIINHYESKFSTSKLVRALKAIDNHYLDYFMDVYSVNEDDLVAAVNKLLSLSNQSINTRIKKTLAYVKDNPEEVSWLCS